MQKTDRKKIFIIVAAHKPYEMPADPIYYPLHVGAARMDHEKLDIPYPGDNTGYNISEKNDIFCELTGLYWAWKNVEADYYGLVHYRRYFEGSKTGTKSLQWVLHEKECRKLLEREGYRVILPKKRRYYIETLYSHYQHTHYEDHLIRARRIIADRCPSYLPSFDIVMRRTSGYMFNMAIMEKKLMNAYCEWVFPILFELEHQVKKDHLSNYQGRFCGRVGELLLNVWIDRKIAEGLISRDEIRELPVLNLERVNWLKKGSSFLQAKFLGKKYESSF